ncbi:MAG: tyrosine-type recombinase/integrase [Nitrospinae bacterium]|nr:tyrosine-type recombinase/integrase [Nitrospinota bacterium]
MLIVKEEIRHIEQRRGYCQGILICIGSGNERRVRLTAHQNHAQETPSSVLRKLFFFFVDTFHCLRHTFATRLAHAGVDLYKISKLLGRRDIKTTQRYAHHCIENMARLEGFEPPTYGLEDLFHAISNNFASA